MATFTEREVQQSVLAAVSSEMFREQYSSVFEGDDRWKTLPVPTGDRFAWETDSTYIRRPPFLENLTPDPAPLVELTGARVLAVLGDSITTDHISPAGSIRPWAASVSSRRTRPSGAKISSSPGARTSSFATSPSR